MFLSHLVSAFRQWLRYSETLRDLSRLDDSELAKLGITRNDIPRMAWEMSEH